MNDSEVCKVLGEPRVREAVTGSFVNMWIDENYWIEVYIDRRTGTVSEGILHSDGVELARLSDRHEPVDESLHERIHKWIVHAIGLN